MNSVPRILVTEPLAETALARLRAAGEVEVLEDCVEDRVHAAIGRCAAVVVRTYTPLTAAVIAAAPHLRVIGRAGVGLDNIDTAAAARRGIAVVYRPAAATQAVAELVVTSVAQLARRAPAARALMRDGQFFDGRRAAGGRQLCELTFGVVGFGRIGQRVATIAHAGFGCPVLFNDIVDVGASPSPATLVTKEDLYASADVVTVHVPLDNTTRGMVGPAQLALMKRDAILVNTSRGAVVDGDAVAAALHAGNLGGAVLDVFDPEPLPAGHLLLTAPNCLLTPHIGARTSTAQDGMNDVVDDVIAVLEGREPMFAYDGA